MYGQQQVIIYTSMQTDKLIGIPVCNVCGYGSDIALLASNNAISPCSEIYKVTNRQEETAQLSLRHEIVPAICREDI
jgi:hypothetical protein